MKLDSVCAGYGSKIIVGGVSLDIRPGEIISLIGPNGGGKSTLLKSISGQLKLMGGAVYLEKEALSEISPKVLSKKLSIVTTERIKPQLMTCRDIVMSGRLPFTDGFGLFNDKDRSEAERAIELMKIGESADKEFAALSDGQKQRALIARAICQSPRVLVMDEPTSYLDIRYRMELMEVIKALSGEGVTVIMSLHELEHALSVSDRLLMIYDDGSFLCEAPEEVINKGYIRDLYGLTEDMYKKVQDQLRAHTGTKDCGAKSDNIRHSSYFLNSECEYFPCHDMPKERFSCMFCYCPLYDMENCGGNYSYTDKGAKNCKDCTFPHDKDNYSKVIRKLKEKMYGDR